MIPKLITGHYHKDIRGRLNYNNSVDLSQIKRIYTITNNDVIFKRAWQGHRIEQRWFTAMSGKFEIKLIKVDDWSIPSIDLEKETFELTDETLDILHIPGGYISSIQSLTDNSKLLIMSDYKLNEIKDDYRFPVDYFKKK